MKQISEFVTVKQQPTVVRLDHLHGDEADWISSNYFLTQEVENHLKALQHVLAQKHGCGMFLIGHYGSGKSHFLAYLAQQILHGKINNIGAFPISLLNYRADRSLESILIHCLELNEETDRRHAWAVIAERFPNGLLLILDELSEFLRSKADVRAFNEDIRFLQFLGEWAQDHPLWILAALQEQIEHTGEMEYDLFRKIKDRFPLRFILTATHIKDLISQRILIKKEGYKDAVEDLASHLKTAFPDNPMDYADFTSIYPIHPTTLALLEEVRDRFSQARGIVGFVLAQLGGDPARDIEPFLKKSWGSLLSPETIVDHFQDLFEVQQEFLPLAQKVFPYYRRHLVRLFPKEGQRNLAERLFKLLILVHLSPAREGLSARQASWWLLYKISSIQPEKNFEVLGKILEKLVSEGSYIKKNGNLYSIDLEEDSQETLEQLLARTMAEMGGVRDAVLESMLPLLRQAEFNPFTLDRDRWQKHVERWHFHEREYHVFFGGGDPICKEPLGLQIGLPWGEPAEAKRCFRLVPKPLEINNEIKELAALQLLADRPLPNSVLKRIRERMKARVPLFAAIIREAYRQAVLMDHAGRQIPANAQPPGNKVREWLRKYAECLFRRQWPQFEDFAPTHGPLPKEAYRQFMVFCGDGGDLEAEDAPDFVNLIREAFLVPMKLMVRKGRTYRFSPKLEKHDLIGLIRPLLEHQPTPKRVYNHLATPVYGLVPDQVNLLLMVLMIQGEIDILKGRSSMRDIHDTFPNPMAYDRIIKRKSLEINQIHDLTTLCAGLNIPLSNGANVLAQRRCGQQLRRLGQKERDTLGEFLVRLQRCGGSDDLASRIKNHLKVWAALEKGENELQGIQHFLFEAGSPRRFLEDRAELNTLPQKFEHLISETERFRHLLANPIVAHSPEMKFRLAVENLGPTPDMSEPDLLESWLSSARRVYQNFKKWYGEKHNEYWAKVGEYTFWFYEPPPLIQSRHLGLEDIWHAFKLERERLKPKICRGLGNLDFQGACHCGFDGEKSGIQEALEKLAALQEEIKTGLCHFFAQDKVKELVSEWNNKGLECFEETLSYLENKKSLPKVENIPLFDQHLAGLELFREMDVSPVLDLLRERVWDKDRLVDAFQRLIARQGPRIAFAKEVPQEIHVRKDLITWCLKSALLLGSPLPKGFSNEERNTFAELIKPNMISPVALKHLEKLGLGQKAEDRILAMVIDGAAPLPQDKAKKGLLAALQSLPGLPVVSGPEMLGELSTVLYREHHRMVKVAGDLWKTRLDELAETACSSQISNLVDLLATETDSQWLLLDCLGLPLIKVFERGCRAWFPQWKDPVVRYALVGEKTTTAAFYQDLVERGEHKAFLKCDVVDELIHAFKGPFRDLEKRVAIELEIAIRKMTDLDPGKPLLIFADHGFRISRDGGKYEHGRDSALERLAPVFKLMPWQ